MSEFRHKDLWVYKADNKHFRVEVSRHEVPKYRPSDDDGIHRWCIYAYIYPKHPHFAAFKGSDLWQDATARMPLHSGCTYLRYHLKEGGEVTSVQVGADYNHLHDSHYTHMATKEDAYSVFADAQRLIVWLSLERSEHD